MFWGCRFSALVEMRFLDPATPEKDGVFSRRFDAVPENGTQTELPPHTARFLCHKIKGA